MDCVPYLKAASVLVTIIIVSWLIMNFAKRPPSSAHQKQKTKKMKGAQRQGRQKQQQQQQQQPNVVQNEFDTELDVRKNDRAAIYFDYGERDNSLSKKLRNLQQSAARVVSSKMQELPMVNRQTYFNK